jgi:hypothetical protein
MNEFMEYLTIYNSKKAKCGISPSYF